LKKKHQILVTRRLTESQIQIAEQFGLDVVVEPAIEIEYRDDWFAVETILKTIEKPVFAFTSQNGVAAFERFKQSGTKFPENTPLYAVGVKTAQALQEIGLKASTPDQQDGTGLAKKIADDFLNHPELKDAAILHFCGDKRRDEFRQFLNDSDIKVRDVVVYETILNAMELPNIQFDGILFYSPSAVHAFRNSGGFINPVQAELFAIGNTTAEELSIESGKHVHISPEPDTEVFLKFAAGILDEDDSKKALR
jgi:uroporphyrinogen-III synthase